MLLALFVLFWLPSYEKGRVVVVVARLRSHVIPVNQSPVKNAVIIPENVPISRTGKPNVVITSNTLRHLITRLKPSVRHSTSRKPSAVKNENTIMSIVMFCF